MKKTLVFFAHPYLEFSHSNQELINFYEKRQNFTFRDLYEEYPDFHIPAFRERKRIKGYDRFIFHFPIIWFGMPPLLRLWLDEVMDGKWLEKDQENPFENREVVIVITTRSKRRSFGKNAKHGFTVEDLISGLLVTLNIFKANIKSIFVVYEAEKLTKKEVVRYKQEFIETLNE